MPEPGKTHYDQLIKETSRQLAICNACRYCEGYCAVWDAIEYRKEFTRGDISYLSNLCHDCGECFDVCPFVPPHEFNVDIPAALSEVRKLTYKEYATPSSSSKLYEKPGRVSVIIGIVSLVVLVLLAYLTGGMGQLGKTISGPGSFYVILPNLVIDIAGTLLALFFIISWLISGSKFLKGTSGDTISFKSYSSALKDGLSGKWMKGGGAGCNYPDRESRGSYLKVALHSMVLYGFLLDLLATITAFIEQDFFGIMPPFPVLSIPVFSGTAGGLLIISGVSLFLFFDGRHEGSKGAGMKMMDRIFLASLLLTAFTGMLLLVMRATQFMGILFLIHISVVSTLFVSAPYGKFVHLVYRGLSTAKYYEEKSKFETS